jgi:hypothetical protein
VTARQLIALLEQFHPDALVRIDLPYGVFEVGDVELENAFISDDRVIVHAGTEVAQ